MRKYARLDDNHPEIVSVLRQMGCSVQSLAAIGSGCPDLLIARCGKMALAEVKDGKKPPSGRRLTMDEELWHFRWKAPVHILSSVDDALKLVDELA